jgi:hypothetical protein
MLGTLVQFYWQCSMAITPFAQAKNALFPPELSSGRKLIGTPRAALPVKSEEMIRR